MTLAEFLLARINEDAAIAGFAAHAASSREETAATSSELGSSGGLSKSEARHITRHDPARVLADCTAKRRVVERWRHWDRQIEDWDDPASVMAAETLEDTMRDFAAVFSEHPDYDESWKP